MKGESNSGNNDKPETALKYIGSNIKLEIGDEILMGIKEEEIDMKDDVSTTSSSHNDSDQYVDGNVASVSYQKPNRKHEVMDYDFKSNGSDIKLEIGDEISMVDIKEKEIDISDEVPTVFSLRSGSDQDTNDNVPSVSYQKPSRKCGGIEYDFKSVLSDTKLAIGNEIMMNIKEEEIYTKDEVLTASSFYNDSNHYVDGNVLSDSYHKPNRKRGEIEYGFKSNGSDIKLEIGDEILMDIKEEEINIKDEIPTDSSFHSDSHQNVDDNVPSASLYYCNICGYKSDRKYNLTVHMRSHTGEKPFVCGLCGFKSTLKANLTIHMRSHTGEKPFVCGLCDFKSARKAGLTIHMRSHTGEKPFVCNLCDFKSAQKANLTIHMKNHTGEKPFVCGLCDFKSTRKAGLTLHMRSHTGEKSFVCNLCDFKSAQKANLTIHMKNHTGEKPFVCAYT